MSWKKQTNTRKNARKEQDKSKAFALTMPSLVVPGTTFKDIALKEHEHLKYATQCAEMYRTAWTRMPLYVSLSDKQCAYRERHCEVRPQVHIGQLKLFLAELKFLMEFMKSLMEQVTVVYAGAADGHHIAYLAQLFPNAEFHLYDPQPFSPMLHYVKNVCIFTGSEGFFNANKAALYSGTGNGYKRLEDPILFISDIRTGNSSNPKCDFEKCCEFDMDMQLLWMQVMRPRSAMFKFRLPYKPGKTKWLAPCDDRHLWYGIFAARGATEMRLISTDADKICVYDNTEMEERACYFNNFTRICQYGTDLPENLAMKNDLGMDNCWDCCAMREICIEYLSKKYEPEFGPCCEVLEIIDAAVSRICDIPTDLSVIIAGYATHIDEQELYGFIGAVIQNCGSNASYKLRKPPHGGNHAQKQWLYRRHEFRGFPCTVKKTKRLLAGSVVKEIEKLYANAGLAHAPPLGKYPINV